MIRFRCKCGKVLQTSADHAGRPIKCPACDMKIRVPGGEESPTGSRQKQRKQKKQRSATPDDDPSGKRSQRRRKKSDRAAAEGERPTRRRRKAAQPQLEEIEEIDAYVDDSDFASEDDFGADDFGADDDYGSGDDYGGYDDYAATSMPSARKKKKTTRGTGDKKKKKSAASGDDEGLSPTVMYAMFGVAGLVGMAVLGGIGYAVFTASGQSSASNEVPTEFKSWKHDEAGLSAEYPAGEGWFIKSGGGTGGLPPWFNIENEYQQVHIRIAGSNSGTAIGDIANAGGAGFLGEELPEELEPIAGIHDFMKLKMEDNYGNYQEEDPVPIESGCGDGRISNFVGKDVLSSEHGVRATVQCHQFVYNIICKCPEKRLEEYRPVFERIISSVGK